MFTKTRILAAATALTLGATAMTPAQAWWHRGYGYGRHYYGHGGLGVGLVAGALVGGLAGAAIAHPYYAPPPVYYAPPPPVVYAPAPPVVYAAPPGYAPY